MAIAGSQPAYRLAQAGVLRGGTSRGNVHSTATFVAIAGVQVAAARAVDAQKVLAETLTISETEGETPNTCSFDVQGFTPTDGQDLVITLGSINNRERLFAGTVLTDAHSYVGTPANGTDTVNGIDYTWQLTRETISQRWTNTSGTIIAQAIVAHANRGFTTLCVAAGLPVLDEFTVTNQTHAAALKALCDRMGATYKATYHRDVQLGLTADPSQTDPTTLTPASALLTRMDAFGVTRDLSQVITRQPVEGGGGTSLAACKVGETQIPISEVSWYNAAGGTVVSGPQRISYSGKTQATPTTAPTVAAFVGAGIDLGPHQWAYTFVSAAGETLPSLLSAVVAAQVHTPAAPATAPTCRTFTGSNFFGGGPGTTVGGSYVFRAQSIGQGYSVVSPDSAALIAIACTNDPTIIAPIYITVDVPNDPYINQVQLFASVNGGAFAPAGFYAVGAGGANQVQYVGSTGGVAYVGSVAVTLARATLAGIALGPSGTTQRNIYRTPLGDTQLKLQQTIANNTATIGVVDSTADASLGANAPTADTSGLVVNAVSTTSGATAVGSTTLNLVNGAAFVNTGGWVLLAGIAVRYAGRTTNQLTGIPATGAGAITAAIPSSSTVTSCAVLLGIPASGAGSILYPINEGDPVNLRVVIDDLAAQAVITALMLPTVDDGVIEGAVMQDGRISETEARARGTAQLALRSAIDVAVTYTSRDLNAHAGRTSAVNLPLAPTSTVGSFKLQTVTIGTFTPALWPIRQCHGASKRFTLDMLLRLARGGA